MRKGFSLIELLVVVAIISILLAFIFPRVDQARIKAQDVAIKANLDSVKTSAEFFYNTYSGYGAMPANYGSSTCDAQFFSYGPIYNAIIASEKVTGSSALCIVADSVNLSVKANSWALSVPLRSDPQKSWCVDSHGYFDEAHASYDGPTNTALCSNS